MTGLAILIKRDNILLFIYDLMVQKPPPQNLYLM